MPTKNSLLSRREFLRLSAIGLGTLAGSRLLSACSPAPVSVTSAPVLTANPVPTAAPAATAMTLPVPTATLAARPLPEIIKFFPTVPSRVIQTHHTGVWSNQTLVPGALRQMLDASITKLTGLSDAGEAWAALFKPGERIAIKVNTFSNSLIWTHVPLVLAVTTSHHI